MFRVFSAVFAVAILFGAVPANAAPNYGGVPESVLAVKDSTQVVLVTAPTWRSTTGKLSTYQRKKNGTWVLVHKSATADLGYGGLVAGKERRQGTGTTPTGTFGITSAFGRKADPGTRLNYIRVDRNDAWTYNPKYPSTYNMFQSVNRSWSSYGNYVERLYSYGKQYNYVAVLDFNLPAGKITQGKNGVNRTKAPANTTLGGGIFLHASNGNKTAGCIAVNEPLMKNILRWIKPQHNPVIVIEVSP